MLGLFQPAIDSPAGLDVPAKLQRLWRFRLQLQRDVDALGRFRQRQVLQVPARVGQVFVDLQRETGDRDAIEYLQHAVIVWIEECGLFGRRLRGVAATHLKRGVRRVEMLREFDIAPLHQIGPAAPGPAAG